MYIYIYIYIYLGICIHRYIYIYRCRCSHGKQGGWQWHGGGRPNSERRGFNLHSMLRPSGLVEAEGADGGGAWPVGWVVSKGTTQQSCILKH